MTFLVEFAGLPGAGKSTASAWALEQFEDAGAARPSPPEGTLGRASWMLRKLVAVLAEARAFALGVRSVAVDSRSLRHKLFACRALAASLQTKRLSSPGDGVLVIDEGVVQRAFMLFVDTSGGADVDAACRYVRAAPLPDVLVYLRVHAETAAARQRARREYLEKLPPVVGLPNRILTLERARLSATMAEGQRLLDAVVETVRVFRPAVRIVEVDAEDQASVNGQLLTQLAPLLRNACRHSRP